MSKILITGGCGYIGSHLIEKLKDSNDICVLDDMSSGKTIFDGIRYINKDINSIHELDITPDIVIHLAAKISADKSDTERQNYYNTNVTGTMNVVEFCKQKDVKHLLFASSAAVYGNILEAVKEEDKLNPINWYGYTKKIGEEIIEYYINHHKVNATIFRFFNIFGGKRLPSPEYAGVISKFKQEDVCIIYGHGEQTRDFVHIDDIVYHICASIKDHIFGTYNIGTGVETSILDLAKITEKPIVFDVGRGAGVQNSVADMNCLCKAFNGRIPENKIKDYLKRD
jgi:UDP-glucose 4-epimerase